MVETNAERVLEELAHGQDWKLDNVGRLIASVEGVQRKVQALVDALPQKWEGEAAELSISRFRIHQGNLGKYRDLLNQVQILITGMGETYCAATCANTTRSIEAQRLLDALPGGVVPPWMHDSVNQGGEVEVFGFGKVDLNSGLEGVSEFFGAGREKAASDALVNMQQVITTEAKRLEALNVTFDPAPVASGGTGEPIKSFDGPTVGPLPGSGGAFPGGARYPGGSDYPGGSGLPGGGSGSDGGASASGGGAGSGGNGSGGGGNASGSGGNGSGSGGDNVGGHFPDINTGGPDYVTLNPGDGGGGDGDGGSSGPSVDSGLEGSTMRPTLGAAGLGAVSLAAGAKLASGGLGGLRGAFGGAGAGGGGAGLGGGEGLRGSAAAAGSGGAGAGSGSRASASASSPGAGGARSGMMMGGGGAGGAKDKKGNRSGLGYIAPTLEDEGDGGPAANASRGGSRGGN